MELRERDLLTLETQENWWVRPKGMTYNPQSSDSLSAICSCRFTWQAVSPEGWWEPLFLQVNNNINTKNLVETIINCRALKISLWAGRQFFFHACTYLWEEPEQPIQHWSSEWGQLLLENSWGYTSSHSNGLALTFPLNFLTVGLIETTQSSLGVLS